MTAADWNSKFGVPFLLTLTPEQRRYFTLNPLESHWDSRSFYSKTGDWYTRLTLFFSGDTIVKVIHESNCLPSGAPIRSQCYTEYDTRLPTQARTLLLPLTARGKPKKLSVSALDSILPFGTRLYVSLSPEHPTVLAVDNPRADRDFPLGHWDAIAAIRTPEDFHTFARQYMESCPENYFRLVQEFRDARKLSVRYRPGDLFRVAYDAGHYAYGRITATVRQLKAMPEFPEKHSLRSLMMVPVLVRMYQLVTEDPNLTIQDLSTLPLGRVMVCADNGFLWGQYPIVDHRALQPEELEFSLVCVKLLSDSPHTTLFTQDHLMGSGLLPAQPYSLYVEWGFASTTLDFSALSPKLKELLAAYHSPHGGVLLRLDPRSANATAELSASHRYRHDLLNPENKELRTELFSCLGLPADTTFDQFAAAFGGLSRGEFAARLR